MTTAQTLSERIDRLSTTTDRVIVDGIKRIQYQHSPAAFIFLGGGISEMFGSNVQMTGQLKRTQRGGRQVQFQHGVTQNTTAKRLSGPVDTYDTTPQDLNRRSVADWKHYSATRSVNLFEELVNVGDEVLVDLITEETRDSISALMELAVQDVFTGTAAGGADAISGLDELISANDTVQGLAGTAGNFTQWNSRGISARGTVPASVSFGAGDTFLNVGLAEWRSAWNNASEGFMEPVAVLTTYGLFEAYESLLVPQERYMASGEPLIGNAGFRSLRFKSAPCMPDPFASSGVSYFLSDKVYVKVLAGADFEFQPWDRATEQETRASELVFKAQLCIEDRRMANKTTGHTF